MNTGIATPSSPARTSVLGLIVAMALIEALSGITQGYLNPILPALGPELHLDDPTINGLFLISNVAFAVMTPIISRLGDSWGCRLVLRISTATVAAGAVLMAVAPSLLTISVGVVLLTCVVGFIPLMMGILRATRPESTRSGVGAMIGTLMITVGVGGLLAGIVGAEHPTLGFWIAVPFAAVALIASFFVPEGLPATREPIAILPLALCSLGLIGLVTALSMGPDWGWLSAPTLVTGLAGILLLALWVRLDLRKATTTAAPRRFIDLHLLAVPRVRTVTIATFLFGFSSISYFGSNGLFLHSDSAAAGFGFGMGPMDIAAVLAAASVLGFLSSLALPPLMARVGERGGLVCAAAILAAGFLLMGLLHGSMIGYVAGFGVFYLGLGMYQAATRTLSVEGVPVEETSTAAGLNELALSVGISIGAAVVRLISAASAVNGKIPLSGFAVIWVTLGLAAALAGVVSLRYPKRTAALGNGVRA
ncbi:MFS transporter [Arthrobacter sp. NPDC090010]|uniref:MFS transporter n=1 Tax=Arthrobacter sp. NPDC090010 TaxID=3363942 RepID=UPI003808C928